MNRYGKLAMEHWQRTDPARYQQIPDPTTFFTQAGQRAETEIQQLADSLMDPDPPDEEFLTKVGRLRAARQQAEEIVLSGLLIPEPEPETESPASDPVSEAKRAIHRALFEDDEPT